MCGSPSQKRVLPVFFQTEDTADGSLPSAVVNSADPVAAGSNSDAARSSVFLGLFPSYPGRVSERSLPDHGIDVFSLARSKSGFLAPSSSDMGSTKSGHFACGQFIRKMVLPYGFRAFDNVFNGTGAGKDESRAVFLVLVPTRSDKEWIVLFGDKVDAANTNPTPFTRGYASRCLDLFGRVSAMENGGFSDINILAAVEADYGGAAAIVIGGCTISGIGSKIRERIDGLGSSVMTRRRPAQMTSQFNASVVQRTVGDGRPAYSILGRGYVGIDLLFLLSLDSGTDADDRGSLDHLLSSAPVGIFVISNSWIRGLVIQAVPSPSPTRGSLELILLVMVQQILHFHVGQNSDTPTMSPTMSSDFGCCLGPNPPEELGHSTWVKTR